MNQHSSDRSNFTKGTEHPWPTHFEGTQLYPLNIANLAEILTISLPKESKYFQAAGRRIILQRVHQDITRLQVSEPALLSTGYEISRRLVQHNNWLNYHAHNNDRALHIREQISNKFMNWHSYSSWYRYAIQHPELGPWLATTVLTPIRKQTLRLP